MTAIKDLHAKWMQDPEYRKAYDDLDEEFALIQSMIAARAKAGLTQAELADRMETSQSAIARLESGRSRPSTRTLERFARATGTRLRFTFEPVQVPNMQTKQAIKELASGGGRRFDSVDAMFADRK